MGQGTGCKAVREVSDVRVQAAQLALQAQQAVRVAQQSEAQARQLIEQTWQEAIGHVENARQVSTGNLAKGTNNCQS